MSENYDAKFHSLFFVSFFFQQPKEQLCNFILFAGISLFFLFLSLGRLVARVSK